MATSCTLSVKSFVGSIMQPPGYGGHRGSIAVYGRTLLEVALDWREQFEAKGWR